MKHGWTLAASLMSSVLVTDQVIKIAVKTRFSLHEAYEILPWFQLLFTENEGMAFGMDFIGTALLTIFRLLAVGGFLWVLSKAIREGQPKGLIVCLSMIIAGAAGNIIDNCLYGLIFTESTACNLPAQLVPFGQGYGTFLSGRVVDMFYFPLFVWPDGIPLFGGKTFFGAIFNFADASISCGAIGMLVFYSRYLLSSESHSKQPEVQDALSSEHETDDPT